VANSTNTALKRTTIILAVSDREPLGIHIMSRTTSKGVIVGMFSKSKDFAYASRYSKVDHALSIPNLNLLT
jgi:hypothetical protein